jgi:hypothetical protein
MVMVGTQDLWDIARALVPWKDGKNQILQYEPGIHPQTEWERQLHHHLWKGDSLARTEFGEHIQCNVVRSPQSAKGWGKKFMLHSMNCHSYFKISGKGSIFFLHFACLFPHLQTSIQQFHTELIYLPTSLHTPHSTVLPEKLTGLQLIKKFPALYGTQRYITALNSARHLSLS